MTRWYLKSPLGKVSGPLNEDQIRAALLRRSDQVQVRQERGTWLPASFVRQQFQRLDQKGFYIRDGQGQIFGPFTKQRVLELNRANQLPGTYWIRQGHSSRWTEISTQLRRSPALPPTNERSMRPIIPPAPVMKLRGAGWLSLFR